jgi:hypothetical protein
MARPWTWSYLATLQEIMSGMNMSYFDRHHSLIIALPLVPVALLAAFTAAVIGCATAITERQDF